MCSIDWIGRNRKQLQKESECSGAGMRWQVLNANSSTNGKIESQSFLRFTVDKWGGVQLEEVGCTLVEILTVYSPTNQPFATLQEAILWAGQTMCSCLILHLWLPNKLAQLAWCNKGHINIRHFLSSKPGGLADIVSWSVSPPKKKYWSSN